MNKEETLEQMQKRWENTLRLMRCLTTEFEMVRALHDKLIRGEYEL